MFLIDLANINVVFIISFTQHVCFMMANTHTHTHFLTNEIENVHERARAHNKTNLCGKKLSLCCKSFARAAEPVRIILHCYNIYTIFLIVKFNFPACELRAHIWTYAGDTWCIYIVYVLKYIRQMNSIQVYILIPLKNIFE